jgi:hypothetical protein
MMNDKQILSETMLKHLLALLDKQAPKDVKQLMKLLDKLVAETKTPKQGFVIG